MPLDSNSPLTAYIAEKKDLYDMGEMPPLGHVPKQMYGWAIRKERHGEPDTAMLQEVLDVPELDNYDVLVLVMAAGINYNGVWAALGVPISPFDGHKQPYHIAGSDASGIVWAVGIKSHPLESWGRGCGALQSRRWG
jgi:crotonyl-CoA carboxylase/reductase